MKIFFCCQVLRCRFFPSPDPYPIVNCNQIALINWPKQTSGQGWPKRCTSVYLMWGVRPWFIFPLPFWNEIFFLELMRWGKTSTQMKAKLCPIVRMIIFLIWFKLITAFVYNQRSDFHYCIGNPDKKDIIWEIGFTLTYTKDDQS
jgi:hypothetical protein